MKARIVQFYQDKIQPTIEALKAQAARLTQQAGGWLARHKRRLGLAAAVIALVVAGIMLTCLWQRSPAFRAVVKNLAAAAAGALAGLWVLLRGQPDEVPVPVAVTEPPYVTEEFIQTEASDEGGW